MIGEVVLALFIVMIVPRYAVLSPSIRVSNTWLILVRKANETVGTGFSSSDRFLFCHVDFLMILAKLPMALFSSQKENFLGM
jgi:hypothetical protein